VKHSPLNLVILCVLLAASETVAALPDLLEVYRQAVQEDAQLQRVQANYEAVLESHQQAEAKALLPTVSINANVYGNQQNISLQGNSLGIGGNSQFLSNNYSLNISQPLFHRDRLIALDQADRKSRLAEVELAAAQQELMLRVVERYFAVLAAQDSLAFAQAQQKTLAKQLHLTQQRFAVGEIAITDVPEAEAGHDRSMADEIEAQRHLNSALESLREITGTDYQSLVKLSDDIPLMPPQPEDEIRWIELALSQNLKLNTVQLAVEIAVEEIRRESAGHYPTLDLVGNHGYTSTGGQFGTVNIDTSSVGLAFNLPIYEGGQVNSKSREAAHRYDEKCAELKQEQRAIHRQTRDAYLGVITGISQVKALHKTVQSIDSALLNIRAGIEVGSRATLDLVIAERESYRVQRDYAQARYDYLLNSLRLKQATGSLSPDDLQQINHWLMLENNELQTPIKQPISQIKK
jgi:outer membrane protein